MKKFVLAAFGAAFAIPAAAAPGDTDTAQGVATAVIVAPIAIVHDGGALDFGTIVPGTTGGTVVVTTAGVGSVTGDVTFVPTSTNSEDTFTVTGDANRDFNIVAGNEVMAGMSFTTDVATTGSLDASGLATVSVGGTLTVAANQAAGTYNGTYDVTVSYN